METGKERRDGNRREHHGTARTDTWAVPLLVHAATTNIGLHVRERSSIGMAQGMRDRWWSRGEPRGTSSRSGLGAG